MFWLSVTDKIINSNKLSSKTSKTHFLSESRVCGAQRWLWGVQCRWRGKLCHWWDWTGCLGLTVLGYYSVNASNGYLVEVALLSKWMHCCGCTERGQVESYIFHPQGSKEPVQTRKSPVLLWNQTFKNVQTTFPFMHHLHQLRIHSVKAGDSLLPRSHVVLCLLSSLCCPDLALTWKIIDGARKPICVLQV